MKRSLSAILAVLLVFTAFSAFSAGDAELMATTPTISFTSVAANGVQQVRINISSTTSGAVIFYTLDGTTPSKTNGKEYDAANPPMASESEDVTVKAIAYNSNLSSGSSVKTAKKRGYKLTAADFPMSPYPTGSSNPQYITVSLNTDNLLSSDRVYYTLNGTAPTESSERFPSAGLRVTETTRLVVRIYNSNYDAPTGSHAYEITAKDWGELLSAPTLGRQLFYGGKRLQVATGVEGATVRYATRTSGSYSSTMDPTSITTYEYTEPVERTSEGTHYFMAYITKDGRNSSPATGNFSIVRCAAPKISVASAANGRKTVTITTTEGELDGSSPEIYYTLDGSTPTHLSTRYTGPITLGASYTLKAVVARLGSVTSTAASQNITASGGDIKPAAPEAAGSTTEANGAKTLSLKTSTDGAEIYYVVATSEDGLYTPTVNDTLYTGPIRLDRSGTYYIRAIAYKNGVYSDPSIIFRTTVTMTSVDKPSASSTTLANGVKTITLSAAEDCKIYCVTMPGDHRGEQVEVAQTDENLYVYPYTVAEITTFFAIAVGPTGLVSDIYEFAVGITGGPLTPDQVGAITVSVTADGAVIDCADAAADIFYVCDNSPSTEATYTSTPYVRGSAIDVTGISYIHVLAARPGYTPRTLTYTISTRTQKPTIDLTKAGDSTYLARFSCANAGAEFYYTTDGSDPTTASEKSGGMAVVSRGSTVKVIAVAPGLMPSEIAVAVADDNFSKCGEIYDALENVYGGKTLYLFSMTSGSEIHYTTDGSEPDENSLLYSVNDGIQITTEGKTTVKAVATMAGYENSNLYELTVEVAALSVPRVQTAANGRYRAVRMLYGEDDGSDYVEGVEMYYELGDSANANIRPDENSNRYESIFNIDHDCYLFVRAMKPGYISSQVRVVEIDVVEDSVATPTLSGRNIMGGIELIASCADADATIYYTTVQGGAYNNVYTEPIPVYSNTAYFSFIARRSGFSDSAPRSLSFSNYLPATAPTASIDNNSVVEPGTKVLLLTEQYTHGSATEDFAIFYTTDGSLPTLDSPQYTGPIEINDDTLIRAVCAGYGRFASPVAEFYYSVSGSRELVITTDLIREGEYVSGSVSVDASAVSGAEGGKLIIALYGGGRMLAVQTTDFADAVDFSDIDVQSADSVIVKAFVFESMDSLVPLCKSSTKVI